MAPKRGCGTIARGGQQQCGRNPGAVATCKAPERLRVAGTWGPTVPSTSAVWCYKAFLFCGNPECNMIMLCCGGMQSFTVHLRHKYRSSHDDQGIYNLPMGELRWSVAHLR